MGEVVPAVGAAGTTPPNTTAATTIKATHLDLACPQRPPTPPTNQEVEDADEGEEETTDGVGGAPDGATPPLEEWMRQHPPVVESVCHPDRL